MDGRSRSGCGEITFKSSNARGRSQAEHSRMVSVTAEHKIETGSRPATDSNFGAAGARVVALKAPTPIVQGGQRVMQNDGPHHPGWRLHKLAFNVFDLGGIEGAALVAKGPCRVDQDETEDALVHCADSRKGPKGPAKKAVGVPESFPDPKQGQIVISRNHDEPPTRRYLRQEFPRSPEFLGLRALRHVARDDDPLRPLVLNQQTQRLTH
jgi:hypothetical protein